MVGGALAHVQGASLKANATLSNKVLSDPRPPGSKDMTDNSNESKNEERIKILEERVDNLQSIIEAGITIKACDNLIVAEFNELSKDG